MYGQLRSSNTHLNTSRYATQNTYATPPIMYRTNPTFTRATEKNSSLMRLAAQKQWSLRSHKTLISANYDLALAVEKKLNLNSTDNAQEASTSKKRKRTNITPANATTVSVPYTRSVSLSIDTTPLRYQQSQPSAFQHRWKSRSMELGYSQSSQSSQSKPQYDPKCVLRHGHLNFHLPEYASQDAQPATPSSSSDMDIHAMGPISHQINVIKYTIPKSSHNALGGGMFSIQTDEDLKQFRKAYLKDAFRNLVNRSKPTYDVGQHSISENGTLSGVFPIFADFDFVLCRAVPQLVDKQMLLLIAIVMQRTVRRFYPTLDDTRWHDQGRMWITESEPRAFKETHKNAQHICMSRETTSRIVRKMTEEVPMNVKTQHEAMPAFTTNDDEQPNHPQHTFVDVRQSAEISSRYNSGRSGLFSDGLTFSCSQSFSNGTMSAEDEAEYRRRNLHLAQQYEKSNANWYGDSENAEDGFASQSPPLSPTTTTATTTPQLHQYSNSSSHSPSRQNSTALSSSSSTITGVLDVSLNDSSFHTHDQSITDRRNLTASSSSFSNRTSSSRIPTYFKDQPSSTPAYPSLPYDEIIRYSKLNLTGTIPPTSPSIHLASMSYDLRMSEMQQASSQLPGKHGMHIHFPHLFVTWSEMIPIYDAWIDDLTRYFSMNPQLAMHTLFPMRPNQCAGEPISKSTDVDAMRNYWKSVLDQGVYGKVLAEDAVVPPHLRMLYSIKLEECPQCSKSKRRDDNDANNHYNCKTCGGSGYVNVDGAKSIYDVSYILNGDGLASSLHQGILQRVVKNDNRSAQNVKCSECKNSELARTMCFECNGRGVVDMNFSQDCCFLIKSLRQYNADVFDNLPMYMPAPLERFHVIKMGDHITEKGESDREQYMLKALTMTSVRVKQNQKAYMRFDSSHLMRMTLPVGEDQPPIFVSNGVNTVVPKLPKAMFTVNHTENTTTFQSDQMQILRQGQPGNTAAAGQFGIASDIIHQQADPSSKEEAMQSHVPKWDATEFIHLLDNNIHSFVQNQIQRLHPNWSDLGVVCIMMVPNPPKPGHKPKKPTASMKEQGFMYEKDFPRYTVLVTGPGSRFCTNVSRSHTRSEIVFLLTVNGICQRCPSQKYRPSEHVTARQCFKYRNHLYPWQDDEMKARLFGVNAVVGRFADCTTIYRNWNLNFRQQLIEHMKLFAQHQPQMMNHDYLHRSSSSHGAVFEIEDDAALRGDDDADDWMQPAPKRRHFTF